MKARSAAKPEERVLDLRDEIKELQELKERFLKDYPAEYLGNETTGGALYTLDQSIKKRLQELAIIESKIIINKR